MTRCAPTAIAACQSDGPRLGLTHQHDVAAPRQRRDAHTACRLRHRASTAAAPAQTLRLDGSEACTTRQACGSGDAVDVVAQNCESPISAKNPVWLGHEPSLRAKTDTAP